MAGVNVKSEIKPLKKFCCIAWQGTAESHPEHA